MSALRRVWDFIVQPTEPIQLWPQTRATIGPIDAASAAVPSAATAAVAASSSTSSAAASALRHSASALAEHGHHHHVGGSESAHGMWEAAGLVGAIVVFQSIQYALDRWYRPAPAQWQANEARIAELVAALQLQPHPEGGFYRRIYANQWILRDQSCIQREEQTQPDCPAVDASAAATAAPVSVDPTEATSSSSALALASASPPPSLPMHFPRPVGSSIYFLLTSSAPTSHLHRLPCDELWSWVEGDPLIIAQVDPQSGRYSERILGPVRLQPPGVAVGTGRHLIVEASSTAPRADSADMAALASPVDQLQLSPGTAQPPPMRCTISFPTHVVPAHTWFGARLADADGDEPSAAATATAAAADASSSVRHGYSLVCCVVTPAFQFEDFELMAPEEFTRLRVGEQLRTRLADSSLSETEQTERLGAVARMVLRDEAQPKAPTATAAPSPATTRA